MPVTENENRNQADHSYDRMEKSNTLTKKQENEKRPHSEISRFIIISFLNNICFLLGYFDQLVMTQNNS